MAAGGKLDQAQAYSSGPFCNIYGVSELIGPGGRCVDSRRVRHRYLRARASLSYSPGPGNFCVGAKQNANGTGANTKYFGCQIPSLYGDTAISPAEPAPGSPLGYATIINSIGTPDYFYGYMQWYP
jgi:hypothetical protein